MGVPAEPVTERRQHRLADLDLRPTAELVALINAEDASVAPAVAAAGPAIAAAVDAIVERLRGGGRLVYVGAGTSGRLAAVDAAECGPTFGIPPEHVIALVAGGMPRWRRPRRPPRTTPGPASPTSRARTSARRTRSSRLSASGRTRTPWPPPRPRPPPAP